MNSVINASAGLENPATDDMIANVNVLALDHNDTDSIIPENLEPAEDILVDVTSSVGSINDPARDLKYI